jgi:methyltransferase (TIGR00027 family)
MRSLAATFFRIVQIILLPIAAVAYVALLIKLIMYSRRSGASATVLASFYTRWMQHKLGTRRDEACERLMNVLPNVSQLGMDLVAAPTLVGHRLTGYVPKIYRYPYEGVPPMSHQPAARTTFYDAAVKQHLAGVEQFVVLGAGLDTRSYRLPPQTQVRCFELDTPKTQAFKREMLRRAGVDATQVKYVPVNFQVKDWFDKLVDGGFKPDRPTLFIWESVTMYLDREAVVDTLRTIAGTASGTVVAFDYFAADLLQSRSLFMRYARAVLNAFGEPFGTFGIDHTPPARKQVVAFLKSCGLSLEEHRNFGQETGSKRAMAGFAIATVP